MTRRLDSVAAYPLAWPDGWPRTPAEKRGSGGEFTVARTRLRTDGTFAGISRDPVTFDVARRKLAAELERLDAGNVTLSTNLPLRMDGEPRADAARRRMDDPGVAVYFSLQTKGATRPLVIACDRFDNPAANMRSIGLAIEAMRALERHGGGAMMERAFSGFALLPPPLKPQRPWRHVFGLARDERLDAEQVGAIFRKIAARLHPDVGGTHDAMAELTAARDEALREIGG